MDATAPRARIALLMVLGLLGVGLLPQAAFAILDDGLNGPPEAVADEINTAEGTPGDTNVLANDLDPDGDSLAIQSWTQATYGSVVCGETECTYTPTDIGFSGSDSFTYTVSDGQGGTDVGDVAVTVSPTNEQPLAVDDVLSTAEDTAGVVDVLVNDTDDDGDPLAVETLSPSADHGTVSCTSGGACTYTPDPDFEGSDLFTYTIADGQGGADSADGAVTVTPVNDEPNAANDSLTTTEDVQGSLNVRANDTDVDGDTLLVTTPAPVAAHGTVSCLGGGACTYTPDPGYNGPDSFQYSISDGHGGSDVGLVSVTVTGLNDDPIAVGDSLTTDADTPGQLDVLANDSDADGDDLSVTGSANGAHGAVTCGAAGICTYTPSANYGGPDTFTYTVADGHGGTDTGSVSITVNPLNDPPVADDETLSTSPDTEAGVNVLAGDADADGDTLTVETLSPSADHGTVSCTSGGTCTYTPEAGYLGADSFTYTVGDGQATDEGLVSVTVEEPNSPPSCAAVKPSKTKLWPPQHQLVSIALSGASDADGDPLSFAITGVKQDEKVKKTGPGDKAPDAVRVAGKPHQMKLRAERDPKANGRVYRIAYRVSDGQGGACTGVEKVGVPVKQGKQAVETAKSFNSFG